MNIDFRRVLHGEQEYELARPLYAGDEVHVYAAIADIYEKSGKSGTMDFLVMKVEGREPGGALIYTGKTVVVVRR
jgi:hydroxyacyl-ACP dehydratase HTD2-like protein with hotdog domain